MKAKSVMIAAERNIGQRLRTFRLARKMSQSALADGLGVTFQQVQKYEKGKNRLSGSRLLIAAEMLSVAPAQILGDNGSQHNDDFAALTDKNVNTLVRAMARLSPGRRRVLSQAMIDIVQAFA